MNVEEFQREFDSKTVAYQPRFRADRRPVVVEIPGSAHSPAGHALASSLVNQLARAHRRLVLVGDDLDQPLLSGDVFAHETLLGATAGLALAINPLMDVDVAARAPSSEALVRIRLGGDGDGVSLGANGWEALTGQGARIGEAAEDIPGALLASCLGAWAAFRSALGEEFHFEERYSLWEYGAPDGAVGPRFCSPLDVGRVLQVGAGGVGAALDYWLGQIGLAGDWTIADGDVVEVSNLNRQMLYLAVDAGYPDGCQANKAELASALLPVAQSSPHWYGEDPDVVSATYDVVLPLANERGVRGALQDRQSAVLLHASTSANYQAQFHRHLGGLDDCIRCRLPGELPTFGCSEARIDPTNPESDAALPFLSATAGLMLLSSLARLSLGAVAESPENWVALDFGGATPVRQKLRHSCRPDCRSWAASPVRRELATGTRFAGLVSD